MEKVYCSLCRISSSKPFELCGHFCEKCVQKIEQCPLCNKQENWKFDLKEEVLISISKHKQGLWITLECGLWDWVSFSDILDIKVVNRVTHIYTEKGHYTIALDAKEQIEKWIKGKLF